MCSGYCCNINIDTIYLILIISSAGYINNHKMKASAGLIPRWEFGRLKIFISRSNYDPHCVVMDI